MNFTNLVQYFKNRNVEISVSSDSYKNAHEDFQRFRFAGVSSDFFHLDFAEVSEAFGFHLDIYQLNFHNNKIAFNGSLYVI